MLWTMVSQNVGFLLCGLRNFALNAGRSCLSWLHASFSDGAAILSYSNFTLITVPSQCLDTNSKTEHIRLRSFF